MNKKRIKRKTGKGLNIYAGGGSVGTNSNLLNSIGTGGSAAAGLLNNALSNASIADTTKLQDKISDNNNTQLNASNNDDLMSEWSSFSPMQHISWKDIRGSSTGQMIGNTIGPTASGITTGAQVGGPIGAAVGGGLGLLSSIGGIFAGNSKARSKAKSINSNIDATNNRNLEGLEDRAAGIDTQNDLSIASNYAALGGQFNTPKSADNNFTNGLSFINAGGTHEQNPMHGVQVGVDKSGNPNLVEEGEVKFNDYVFSNRLPLTLGILNKVGLASKYKNNTFAKVASDLSKESLERPNDPISKRGLMDAMSKLHIGQEGIKDKLGLNDNKQETQNESTNKFAIGGYTDPLEASYPISEDDLRSNELPTSMDIPKSNTSSDENNNLNYLRYAPAVATGISTATDMLGLTNKPDYDTANLVGNSINSIKDYSSHPISNYLSYTPFDRNYYSNKLNAQAGATRNSIVNQAGGNRGVASAGLLAADYNAQNQLGDLYKKAEEYNRNQRERVATFNRGTDQYNSTLESRTDAMNQQNNSMRLQGRYMQGRLMNAADAQSNTNRSMNASNFINSLGDIGSEEYIKNLINSNKANKYTIDSSGRTKYKK